MSTNIAPTVVEEVASGIHRVRLPLPFALNHVNCYLLEDGDGWTVLDTGLHRPEIYAGWQAAFTQLGIALDDVRRIIVTHMHPDHIGLAGRLQRETGATVFMSPREWEVAEAAWVHGERQDEALPAYLRRVGAPPEVGAIVASQQQKLRQMTQPTPVNVAFLNPGETIAMAGRRFEVIHAPGHADGQIIFYAPSDRLMLCGDQVLQQITPNIGLWPSTQPNPLKRYMDSLRSLMALDVAVALPGHHAPITDWRGRLCELLRHHEERLEVAYAAAADGATALEASYAIFNFDRLTPHEIRFAVAEALAHLEYLAEEGRLERYEKDGFVAYREHR
ncbi:MAG: MBL fold metallo-hydrolase [Caldilinea sp.]|nr:MBL fold metallo-hydrolase [Caldilinea sp.]MDW8440891.1 MBL fold metallo-hydrolase [Caldilineaceae bacterium]